MDLGTPLDADALRDALARHAADGLCDATTQLSPAEVTAMFPPALSDAILQSYVDTHPYSYDHVRHFELLVDRQLGAIFDEGGTVEVVSFENGVSHVVRLRNVSFQKPTTGPREGQPRGLKVAVGGGSSGLLYPTEATLCGLTYAVTICVDVEHYTYKLVRVPDAAAAPMPSNTPPAFSVLPTVYREVRRRLVWWDPAVGAPAALEKALDRDTAAYNATRIEAARADGTAATLARPSQLLADAVNGTDHVMVHALLAAWVAVRAAAEGAPCPHITPLPSPLVLPAAGGAGVAADVGSTLKAGADVAGVDVVGEDGEDGDDEDDEDAAASASDDEATAVAAKADVASRQHRYIQQLVGAPVLCRELPIAQLPCMLGCKYDNAMDLPPSERDTCILDHGGTFISRGTLKCIRSQKVQRPNVWVIEGTHRGPVTANVRSLHPEKFRSSSTLFLYLAPSATGASSITINVPFLPKYLPVVTVYRLLGFNVKDIVDLVFAGCDGSDADDAAMRRLFAANFSDPAVVQSMHELYEAVGGGIKKPGATPDKRRQQVHQQITAELLPHIGFDDLPLTRLKKALYLGLIIRDMLKVRTRALCEFNGGWRAWRRVDCVGCVGCVGCVDCVGFCRGNKSWRLQKRAPYGRRQLHWTRYRHGACGTGASAHSLLSMHTFLLRHRQPCQ